MANAVNDLPVRLRQLAGLQGGVITRHQAREGGLSADAIKWAARRGAWQQVYPGVYATFTGPLVRQAQLWAALLAAGQGAVLSHQTAAEITGLADSAAPLIHVTIPNERRVRPPRGIAVHVSRRTSPPWRFARGIPPHTMPEETVIDLVNAAGNLDEAVGWITVAFARHLTSEPALRRAIAARSRVRWREQLGEILTVAADGTQSILEFRYDRDVEQAHGLPPAARQVRFTKPDGTRGFRDRCYEQYGRLVVELDGQRYHQAGGTDRARDNQAAAGGAATLRYDWADIARAPCETAAQVWSALRQRGYDGNLKPCGPGCRAPAATGTLELAASAVSR